MGAIMEKVLQDRTITTADILEDLSETLYRRLNLTREQQLLALRCVTERLVARAAKEELAFDNFLSVRMGVPS